MKEHISSGYRGVYRSCQNGRWNCRIRIMGKTVHLGTYDSEIAAAKAYDKAAKKWHGKHAKLNFSEVND